MGGGHLAHDSLEAEEAAERLRKARAGRQQRRRVRAERSLEARHEPRAQQHLALRIGLNR